MMLYNQRVEFVLQQLQLQSTVKVSDLSRQLQVSVDTVRRDLKAMEQQGLIRCVRGGACMPESRVSMSDFNGREIIHSDLKREAARKALAYIHEGDVVALNSGTTNTVLAQELLSLGKKFTVVTNNFAAASVLLQAPQIRLVLVGGQLDLPVFEEGQGDPVQIAADAIRHARDHGSDMVFLDTAGRLHVDESLMDELKRMKAAVHPNEILLVVDAMTGHEEESQHGRQKRA